MKLATHNCWWRWALLAVFPLFAECAIGQAIVLLRAVSVSGDSIRFSDLLPAEAPVELRRAGAQIELGRTPQCDTIRLFDPSEIARRTSAWPMLRGLTVSSPVSVRRTCFPIPRELVQEAISEFLRNQPGDATVTAVPLPWSDGIFTSRQSPALEVERTLSDPARRALQVRLRCVERAVCPSFWIAVPLTVQATVRSAAKPVNEPPETPVLVNPGQRMMLTVADAKLRIQFPVTSLQRGSLGKEVRVMDRNTRRIFRAEVTSAGTVTAHL